MISIEELTVEIARLRDALKQIEALIWYEPEDYDDLVSAVRVMKAERDEAQAELALMRSLGPKAHEAARQRDENAALAESLRVELEEAQAQIKALQGLELSESCERDDLRAEVERLRAERDDARVCLKFAEAVRDAVIQEREDAEQERDEARRELCDILAVIHRDGGHHTGKHGVTQSVADAHAAWAALVQERDELQALLSLTRAEVAARIRERDENSDVCWKLEQEMYVRQRDENAALAESLRVERDEARAEVERLRAELSALRIQRATERARDGWAEVERLRALLDGYSVGDE